MTRSAPSLAQLLTMTVNETGSRPLSARHLAVVTMTRDQLDILPSFLSHHLALVDRIYAVDHRSEDGTREYLMNVSESVEFGGRVIVYRYDGIAHNQAAIMTALAERAFADGIDWVFAIDGDEFLAFDSRGQLQAALESATSPVVQFDWLNLMPQVTGAMVRADAGFDPGGIFESIIGDATPRYGKLTIHRSFHARFPAARFRAGQHKIHPYPGSPKITGEPLGRLLHVPARSVAQVRSKRDNLARTADFLDVFPDGDRRDFVAQLQAADDLVERIPSEEEVATLFEAVILPYEPDAVRTRPRSAWLRRTVRLPITAIPGGGLVPRAWVAMGPLEATGRPSKSPADGADLSSRGRQRSELVVELTPDGQVVLREDRSARLRHRLVRARAEARLRGFRGSLFHALIRTAVSLRPTPEKRPSESDHADDAP